MKVRYRRTFYAVSLVFSDIFMILTSLKGAFWLKFESGLLEAPFGTPDFASYSQTFGFVVILMLVIYRAYGLYQEERVNNYSDEAWGIWKASSVAFMLLLGISFFYRGFSFSRGYILTAWVVVPSCVLLMRVFIAWLYFSYRRSTNKFTEVLLIGCTHDTAEFAVRAQRERRKLTRVVGILEDGTADKTYKNLPILGQVSDLDQVLSTHPNINRVVVTSGKVSTETAMKLLLICEKHLVSFHWAPDVLALMAAQMEVSYDSGFPLLSLRESRLMDWENRVMKRLMDIACSFVGLVLLSPLLAVVAWLVRRDSPGPVFYRQERVGEDGKTFEILKFRTMRVGAEAHTGPVWAKEDDDRRTNLGSFLRAWNIDELPQLWNVFKGDMSLVGPRPERPHFVGQFRESVPRYMGRHRIKSGVTGWAQVHGLRGNTSIEERTRYDLYYIENWSLGLDIRILLRTFAAFKNAY